MDQTVVDGMKVRYEHLHPLIFHRSVERAKSLGDLFDILEGCPKEYPLVWDDKTRQWKAIDLLLTKKI